MTATFIIGLIGLFAVGVAHSSSSALTRDQQKSRAEIIRVFGSRAPAALRVAWCESHWRTRAWSATSDGGVFQINYAAHHYAGESIAAFQRRMFDRVRNVAFAYRLSAGGTNWAPWGCRWAA